MLKFFSFPSWISTIIATKELGSKNKDSNIIRSLWLLLFPILISQGRQIELEGRGQQIQIEGQGR